MPDLGRNQEWAITNKSAIMGLGDIDRFVVKYSSTTAVAITAGKIEANGKYFVLEADTTHSLTSLASAFDFHYIYIDDSASTSGGTPIIIDATTEPAWSDAKVGWYNGDDKSIGVVASTDGAATIYYFDTVVESDKKITYNYGVRTLGTIASSMNPDGSWQTPNVAESSTLCPVNSIEMKFECLAFDSGAQCNTNLTSNEMASSASVNQNSFLGYDRLYSTQTVILGTSRNVKIAGGADDDNSMGAYVIGFAISR